MIKPEQSKTQQLDGCVKPHLGDVALWTFDEEFYIYIIENPEICFADLISIYHK